jgi:hypothetical protein
MTIRKNSLVLTAAFSGVLCGTTASLSAAPSSSSSNPTLSSLVGQLSTTNSAEDKRACEGMNCPLL